MHFVSGLHKALASSTASELQHGQHGQLVRLEQLPLRCVEHLSETRLLGAGFDGEVCPEGTTLESVTCDRAPFWGATPTREGNFSWDYAQEGGCA